MMMNILNRLSVLVDPGLDLSLDFFVLWISIDLFDHTDRDLGLDHRTDFVRVSKTDNHRVDRTETTTTDTDLHLDAPCQTTISLRHTTIPGKSLLPTSSSFAENEISIFHRESTAKER